MQDDSNEGVDVTDVDLAIAIYVGQWEIGACENHSDHGIDIADVDFLIVIHITIDCIRMIIDATGDLGRGFTHPSTILVHGIIDLDEVNVFEVDVTALFIHRPVNLEARVVNSIGRQFGIVGQVVHILFYLQV